MADYSSTGSDIAIKHLCAVMKLNVLQKEGGDTDNLIAVRFSGLADEQVCGDFDIDYDLATLTGVDNVAANRSVKVVKNQATSTTEAVSYYIVVPAMTYASGIRFVVQDLNGDIMTIQKAGSVTLAAGKMYNMAEKTFEPNGTAPTNVEIASAEDLINFATRYNNKEFEGQDDLVVEVTADIAFDATTSAAFNATKGIGLKQSFGDAEDYYFNGLFKGGDHTISGLVGTAPIFTATGSSGVVKNLTLDNTCSFTFTHPNTAEADFGAVVNYHKGMLDHVIVEANVSLTPLVELADTILKVTALGGLVGRETEGTIQTCSYSGAISIPADFRSREKQIQIGGLVGRVSNANGKVLNSTFWGTIENEGQMIAKSEEDEDDWKNNPYLMIGGIVGLNSGTVGGCTANNNATGITVILNDGSDHPYTGTVVTHSVNAYHYAIAGIVGRNDGTVSSCTNNAGILNVFSAARGASGNMNGRYLNVAGIAGYNSKGASVQGCTNNGAIIDRANPKMHYVGGIVGRNLGTVSSCNNASSGTIGVGTSHTSPYGARMLYLGGVIGNNDGSSSVSNIQNAANLTVSRIENTTGIICIIGGVVGRSAVAVDGTSGSITNSGTITQSSGIGRCDTPTASNDYGLFLGGVVGYATKAVKNVSNSGAVTYTCTATGIGAQYVHLGGVVGKVNASSTVDVEHCVNTANVTFTASATHKANANTRYYFNYLGGIVGYAKNAAIKGDSSQKSTNSGQIKGGDGSDNNNQGQVSFVVGGIVGYLTGTSSIDYCSLSGTGNAYNDHWSNRGIGSYDCPTVGGIAGQVVGEEGKLITVSNCDIASTATINARRGALGGIVGLAKYSTVSNCSVPINYSTTQSGYFYGGVVAAAQNSTISNCTFSGTTIQSSQMQIGGGIVGQLDTNSIVDACSSYAATVNKNGTAVTTTGGIAGKTISGNTIQNCHYTSAIGKVAGSGAYSGEGNVADL